MKDGLSSSKDNCYLWARSLSGIDNAIFRVICKLSGYLIIQKKVCNNILTKVTGWTNLTWQNTKKTKTDNTSGLSSACDGHLSSESAPTAAILT